MRHALHPRFLQSRWNTSSSAHIRSFRRPLHHWCLHQLLYRALVCHRHSCRSVQRVSSFERDLCLQWVSCLTANPLTQFSLCKFTPTPHLRSPFPFHTLASNFPDNNTTNKPQTLPIMRNPRRHPHASLPLPGLRLRPTPHAGL
jgi:hypothetical protein